MTQVILVNAFRAELVPTEAELARTERQEYESGEQLLERIKADGNSPMMQKRGKELMVQPQLPFA